MIFSFPSRRVSLFFLWFCRLYVVTVNTSGVVFVHLLIYNSLLLRDDGSMLIVSFEWFVTFIGALTNRDLWNHGVPLHL